MIVLLIDFVNSNHNKEFSDNSLHDIGGMIFSFAFTSSILCSFKKNM